MAIGSTYPDSIELSLDDVGLADIASFYETALGAVLVQVSGPGAAGVRGIHHIHSMHHMHAMHHSHHMHQMHMQHSMHSSHIR